MTALNEKKYFLKNSNLLEEIHKSKISYCCYTNEEYTKYDVICDGYELVTPNLIQAFFEKNPDRDYIIIRVITAEHIPEEYFNKSDHKPNLQSLKLNPFKHFLLTKKDFNKVFKDYKDNVQIVEEKNEEIKKIDKQIQDNKRQIRFYKLDKKAQIPFKEFNLELKKQKIEITNDIKCISSEFSNKIRTKMKEVLRSHWVGDTIETGHFSVDHGRMTDTLAKMIMLMVEQYARKGSFNRYTYLEDMKSTAIVNLYDVALKFEENKSSNPFAYLTQCMSMKFTATLNSEAVQRAIKSKMLQMIGYDATFGDQVDEEYRYKQEDMEREMSSNN